ncbi:hypothetical protein LTR70_008119 [Exophiala xenobiotica]|uniref:Uncharacterized protein n=1 Tax=Lithohypha guttulata TaxID=1690604 RepID=A0ABR0JZB7_9EURO|nr:hypothetical protein LTR24_009183 [Lithohypha guttulata]KAK5312522.1 hypothetical protein LTR70_008119 [Exophiala xenobiotica]
MSAIIAVIGLVSGVFQSINTPESWMAPPHVSSTKVRVYSGMSGSTSESTSGNIPGVALWDAAGGFIGKAMGVYNYVIDDGKFHDLEVKGKKASAEYLSVSAFGTDGLCVAAVAVTSPTGYKAGWFGDIGRKCGAPWYPSNLVIPGSDPEARPACVWIDQDGSNNHPYTGLTIHLPSFTRAGLAQEYNDNIDTLCRSLPRFSMWTTRSVHMTLPVYYADRLEFNEDGSDKNLSAILDPQMMQSETTAPNDPTGTALGVADGPSALDLAPVAQLAPSRRRTRRQSQISRPRPQPLQNQLVVSNVSSHSARELCGSRTSAGPDFVSLGEGLFCDMARKVLWPVCSEEVTAACFDLGGRGLRVVGGAQHSETDPEGWLELRVRSEDGGSRLKSYRNVQRWS